VGIRGGSAGAQANAQTGLMTGKKNVRGGFPARVNGRRRGQKDIV